MVARSVFRAGSLCMQTAHVVDDIFQETGNAATCRGIPVAAPVFLVQQPVFSVLRKFRCIFSIQDVRRANRTGVKKWILEAGSIQSHIICFVISFRMVLFEGEGGLRYVEA